MAFGLNQVQLIGRLGRDAEVRVTQSGGKVANLAVATDESYIDRNSGTKIDKVEWHRVVSFQDGVVEMLEKHATKGRLVYVLRKAPDHQVEGPERQRPLLHRDHHRPRWARPVPREGGRCTRAGQRRPGLTAVPLLLPPPPRGRHFGGGPIFALCREFLMQDYKGKGFSSNQGKGGHHGLPQPCLHTAPSNSSVLPYPDTFRRTTRNPLPNVTAMNISASDIQRKLQRLGDLPTPVGSWQVETGFDSTDDPAVWVWAWLKDDHVDRITLATLRRKVHAAVRSQIPDHVLVYTRFPRLSEKEPAA